MSTNTLEQPKTRKGDKETRPPLLDNGYRLLQVEFHRRYERMLGVKKAELIEGIVIMGSPVSYQHARATQAVHLWLGHYALATPGVESADNASLILDADNEFQPDAILRIEAARGGRSRLVGKYLQGAPELVVEVSVTSVAHDLHDKFKVYRRNGVLEYLVWQLDRRRIDWFAWEDADYAPLKPNAHGLHCSRVFPGLWLDTPAMVGDDRKKVLHQLQKGIDGAEHRQFVKKLCAKTAGKPMA